MRKKVLAMVLVAVVGVPSAAWAAGPSGSKESKKTGQVKCRKGAATPAGKVYAGSNGVEACSDNTQPPDGRIIVSFSGRYVSADGDPSNGEQSNGFIRVDQSGPSCGTAKKRDSSAGRGGSCQPSPPDPLPVP